MINIIKKPRLFIIISVLLFSLIAFTSKSFASEQNTSCYSHPAVADIRQVVDKILIKLRANQDKLKSDPKIVHGIIDDYLVPKADFELMSQMVLTKYWKKLNSTQKDNFKKQFKDLMIKTYSVAFESYEGETVDFLCPIRTLRGKQPRIEISSVIHHVKQPNNKVKFRFIEFNKICEQCENIVESCLAIGSKCKKIKTDLVNKADNNSGLGSDLDNCKEEYKNCKQKADNCNNSCAACEKCANLSENEIIKNTDCKKCFEWQVYDLIVDNVSIINSYRTVFSEKFSNAKPEDYDRIIRDINKKDNKQT